MIPYDLFYRTIDDVLLNKIGVNSYWMSSFETLKYIHSKNFNIDRTKCIVFYDQEPIDLPSFYKFLPASPPFRKSQTRILLTSEYSNESNLLVDKFKFTAAQYFYHALLCHEWYRHHWYQNIETHTNFNKVYITYNNLILDKRLYRTNLVFSLKQRGLVEQGLVSFSGTSEAQLEKSIATYRLLPTSHKENIGNNLSWATGKMTIDTEDLHGSLSATVDHETMQQAFVNLVTETIFYENKVHLTEKIFKPIVAKMPFLLLAGAGNLEYLRRYGFKTFGDFWDESYDSIIDPATRFDAVLAILTDLCNRPHHELVSMKQAMTDILEYNYYHFYKTMRPIVVDELTTGLAQALTANEIAFDPADLANLNRILTY